MTVKLEKTRYEGIYRRPGLRKTTYIAVISTGTKADGNPKQVKRTFAKIVAARTWRTEQLEALQSGTYIAPSSEPLGLYLDRWVDAQRSRLRPSSMRTYKACAVRLRAIHDVEVGKLDALKLMHWQSTATGYTAKTIRLTLSVLGMALNDAVKLRLIRVNPVPDVRIDRRYEPLVNSLTQDELARLLPKLRDDEWSVLWEMALETAARPGELIAMRIDDIDWERNTWHVSRTRTYDENGKLTEGPPKTAAGYRTIPLSDRLMKLLRKHRAIVRERQLGEVGWNIWNLLFPGEHGGAVYREGLARRLTACCEAAGIRRITLHGLRHTGATMAIAAGISAKAVAERLGHTGVAITLDRYVHPDRTTHEEAAKRISDGLLSG